MERYAFKRLVIFFTLLVILSCSSKGQKKIYLIDKFYVNQSYKDIQKKYLNQKYILDSGKSEIIFKTNYEHLDNKGVIDFYFLNKKLYQTTFYPYDTLIYLDTLNKVLNADVRFKDIETKNIGIYLSYKYVSETRKLLHLERNLCISWYTLTSEKAIYMRNFSIRNDDTKR